jgi:hypothetical protein
LFIAVEPPAVAPPPVTVDAGVFEYPVETVVLPPVVVDVGVLPSDEALVAIGAAFAP